MPCNPSSCEHSLEEINEKRRRFLQGSAGAALVSAAAVGGGLTGAKDAAADSSKYADPDSPALPQVAFDVTPDNTALVIVDPQDIPRSPYSSRQFHTFSQPVFLVIPLEQRPPGSHRALSGTARDRRPR